MSIAEVFHQYFEIVRADQPEDVVAAQKLRYQVYVVERSFEDAEDHASGLEQDRFDPYSAHSLLLYKNSHTPSVAGNVRLILGSRLDSGTEFPIEEQCADVFYPEFRRGELPRRSLGEISRFALSKQFRKRFKERSVTHGLTDASTPEDRDEQGRRIIPHLTIGLFKALLIMSCEQGITHWYAVMEPTLLRILKRFGIEFEQIGEAVDYHGMRLPCIARVEDVVRTVYARNREIWTFATDDGALWSEEDSQPVEPGDG